MARQAAGNPRNLFFQSVALLNAFLLPIAAVGLYLSYLGRREGSTALLALGVIIVIVSPFLAYMASRPVIEKVLGVDSSDSRGAEKP